MSPFHSQFCTQKLKMADSPELLFALEIFSDLEFIIDQLMVDVDDGRIQNMDRGPWTTRWTWSMDHPYFSKGNRPSLPEANMWKPCEILCEKKTNFTHFSYHFHTCSHVFHIIFSRACEIILCERHVKDIWKSMWNRVILFTYFFTCNFTHFSARFIGRNFACFSHASSLRSSHTFHMQFHTLWQILLKSIQYEQISHTFHIKTHSCNFKNS